MRAGRLGMARTSATSPPSQRPRSARRMPAATDTTSRLPSAIDVAIPAATRRTSCGFTAITIVSAPAAAAALSAVARMPYSRSSAALRAPTGSATVMKEASTPRARNAPIRLVAMFPPPMKAIRMRVPSGPGSEYRRADSHDRGALGDRSLEVAAHTHRQRIERMAPPVEIEQQFAQSPEWRALRGLVGRGFGHAHQTAKLESRHRAHGFRERRQRVGIDAGLSRLVAEPHLQQDLEPRTIVRPLLGQSRRNPFAIDAVHPVERGRDLPRFVRLHTTDEVPADRQSAQRRELGFDLLQVVLAEIALAGGVCCADPGRVPSGNPSRRDNPSAYGIEARG